MHDSIRFKCCHVSALSALGIRFRQINRFAFSRLTATQRSLPGLVIENTDDIIGRLRRGARCGKRVWGASMVNAVPRSPSEVADHA